MSTGSPRVRQTAQEWSSRGYQCTYRTASPGQHLPKAVYDTDSVIVVLAGQLEVSFKGATHFPGPGRRVHVPAGVQYTVRTADNADSAWLRGLERDLAQTD